MQNQENENYQDTFSQFSQQLMSSNWKTRKDTLEIISKNMENQQLQSVFWQLVNTLMRDQNIQCLGLTLHILHDEVLNIPRNRLEEIVFILVNNNLLNQKTSIHKTTEDLLLAISSQYPKLVLDTITVSLDSKIAKQIKSSLLFIQLLVMQQHQLETKQISQLDFCSSLLNILQTKDLLVRKQVIEVIDLLLQMSTNQQELLDFLQHRLDKQLFQNIVNQLMTEHVSDEEIVTVLQEKTEKVDKQSPLAKKQISSPTRNTQIVGQSLGNSHFLKEDTYTPSYTELQQLSGMNWKDRKQILEQLTKEFEGVDKITQQLSSEFCRQLRQLLEEENNFPCLNQLIKLTGEICLKVQGCKYLRTLFSALFQCLRNKKCQSQVQSTLLSLLQVIRIQDIIDSDIMPAMQTRQTEFKIDVINFIKAAYWLNPGGKNDQVLSGTIIRDSGQHEKLLKLLLTTCNDSNNILRQAASDALVQFITVHIQLKQYCSIVYQHVVQGYIQETHNIPQNPQQLISVILTFNGQQNIRSNEQRRGGALLTSLVQLLTQFNIPSYVVNLAQIFNFNNDVQQLIDQLNQSILGPQKSVVKKNHHDKINSPIKLTKSQPLEQDFQWMAQQRQGSYQPEVSVPQYQDITKIQPLALQPNPIQQIIQKYQMQLQSADQQLLQNLHREVTAVLQSQQSSERQIAIDIFFDTMLQQMAQGDENLLIQCIQFIKSLILQWQSDVHPTTILKSLDVLIFRMEESQPYQFIYDFIACATQLYGVQLPMFFVQKYIAEQFIVNTLLQMLFKLMQEFGLQGLDFNYNIIYNRLNTQCNITQLLIMCTQTECDHQDVLNIMSLVSTILLINDQETLFLMQQEIQENQTLSTLCVQLQRIEIQQPQQVINPIQIQQTIYVPQLPQEFESKIPVISSTILEQQKSALTPRQHENTVEDFDAKNQSTTLNGSSLQKPFSPKASNPNIQTVQHIQLANTNVIKEVSSLKMYFMEIFQVESPKYVLNESGVKKTVINFITPELQNNIQRFIQILMQSNPLVTEQLIQHSFMNNIYGTESDIYQIQELINILNNQQNISEMLSVLLHIHLCQSVIYNDQQQHNAICQLFNLVSKDENYLDTLLLYIIQSAYQSQNCQQLIRSIQHNFELKSLLNTVQIVFIDKYQNSINGSFLLYQTLNFIAHILQTCSKNQQSSKQDQQSFVKCMLQVRSQLYYYNVDLIIQELQRITDSSECIKDLPLNVQKDLILSKVSSDLKQYIQYLNNLNDNEQFIYGLKQIIIYIRDHREQSYNSIVVNIQENICIKLFKYINNQEQPNSRLLKYCALLLLELLNDQKSLKYISIENLQQIMRISSYYLMIYIPGLQLNDQAQQKLFSESYENFTLVFQRIAMEIPFFYRYQAFIGELYNICHLLMTKDLTSSGQDNYTFLDEIQFINQYQAQFVIKNLLQMQQVLKKEFEEQQIDILIKQIVISGLQDQFNQIMYLITASVTQPVQALELMQLITSQPYSGLVQIDQRLSQISVKQEIELKELKLFLRYTRIFVEYYISSLVEIQYSAGLQPNYFMLLVQAVSESKQIISSFQGSIIRDQGGSQYNSQVKASQIQSPTQKSVNNFGTYGSQILEALRDDSRINFDVLLNVYQKIKGFPDFQNALEQLLAGNRFQAPIVGKITQQIARLHQCEQAIMLDLRK